MPIDRRSFVQSSVASLAGAVIVPGTAHKADELQFPTPHRQPRFLAGIACYSYRDALGKKQMTYEDVINQAVGMGLETVDLTVYWLNRDDRERTAALRRYAYTNGIHWSGIAAHIEFTGATATERQEQFNDGKRWIDFANTVGASHVRIFGGDRPKNMTEEQIKPHVVEGMRALAEYSGTAGILLGIENDYGVTATAEQVLYYVKEVNSPWLGLNVDTFNSPEDSYSVIERLMPYATHVHIKPLAHDAKGKEVQPDWPRMFTMFAAAGYRGSVSLEYEGNEKPEVAIPRLGRALASLAAGFNQQAQRA
jgi:sugar phosphate isomerase/epimerase